MKIYICPDCGEKIEESDDVAKWSAWTRCYCGGEAVDPTYIKTSCKLIPGYSAEGYNEGLGVHIRGKQHLKEVLKEREITEAG
jgi:hypothetical protein